jgi:hypothetical protein
LVATSLVVVYSSMIVIVSKDIATKDVTDVAKFFVLTLKYFLCFMLICHAIGIWAGISRIIYLKLRGYTCSGVSPMMLL